MERSEFREARERLVAAGYHLRDEDAAWGDFVRVRSGYAGRVNALARHFATPPAQWIGDRSVLHHPTAR